MKTNSFLYFLPCVDGRVIRCAAFVGLVIIAGVGSLSFAANTDGTVDPTFGVNGRSVTDVRPKAWDWAYSAVLQSDGKIVAGGTTSYLIVLNDFALVRYNSDGTVDPKFGVNGRTVTDFKALPDGSRSIDLVNSIVLQSDRKIVAAGFTNSPNGDYNFALVRYNSNGTVDPTFGVKGRTVTDFKALPDGNRSRDLAQAVILQPDGKIVAAGFTSSPNGDPNFALVRYNPNGTVDPKFGVNGRSVTDFKALPNGKRSDDYARAVILQPDGKIVAAGSTNSPNGDPNFALVRYNSNGTVDPKFGVNGRTVTDFKALSNGKRSSDEAHAVILQPDGKIVAAGFTNSPNGDLNFALVRYNSNGTVDATFGVNGRSVTDFKALPDGKRSDDYAYDVILQPNGKIVAAGGTNSPNGDNNFALVRYNSNGTVDPTFGVNGRSVTDFKPINSSERSADTARSVILQSDGKILVTGYTDSPNKGENFAVVRYLNRP